MLNSINMEFIQAFNPLYAVPIVAVIFCAFLVYAFGFKSPVQPPSFEGIEEEKKYTKKRRGKETQKSNKVVQNGKANGSVVAKSTVVSTKKKETNEKPSPSEKSGSNIEKTVATAEKKASKKNKAQNEKKSLQEKKKESFVHDELNDDGWVQLISRKGRKNRKKDDITPETNSSTSVSGKATEANKSDDSSPVEESPKKTAELQSSVASAQSTKDQKQPIPATKEETVAKDSKSVTSPEKPKIEDIVVEVSKPDNKVEKQLPKETAAKGIKVLEESSKSKKKKKKNTESIHPENEPVGNISNSISETSPVLASSESVAPKKTAATNSGVIDSPQVNSSKVEVNQPSEVKTSNVVFDELAGLYPEPKEQKKKKKVRRDH